MARWVTPPGEYRKIGAEEITPSDSTAVKNLTDSEGYRCGWIQVTGAGNVVYRNRDGSFSLPLPCVAGQAYRVGLEAESIVATSAGGNTTATGIIPYWI